MITIVIDHVWCGCNFDSIEELEAVRVTCGYYVEGNHFSSARQDFGWDGFKSLFRKSPNKLAGKFPAGLLQHTILSLQADYAIDLIDKRSYYAPQGGLKLTFTPRDYQLEAAEVMVEKRKGIVKLPTAAGKTKTAIAVIAKLNMPTLWLTHEGALARQSKSAIEEGIEDCPDVGMYGSGKKDIQFITIGMVQSLSKQYKKLKKWLCQIQVLVVDESHHGSSKSWYKTIMNIPAPYRFGISATPFDRGDQRWQELVGGIGPLIYEKEAEEVSEHLSRPNVHLYHTPHRPRFISGDWPERYEVGIVNHEFRNNTIVQIGVESVREKQPTIIFVSRLQHGYELRDRLTESIGLDCFHEFIHGQTPQDARDKAYNDLRSGKKYVIIATDGVAGEGQDVPAIRRVVIGGGYKAAILVKQRIGRGMRPDGDNNTSNWGGVVQIYDFVDEHDDRLYDHSQERIAHYEQIGSTFETHPSPRL